MEIRRYKKGEERAIWNVYYGSTRNIVAREYTAPQVERWAPHEYDESEWTARFAESNPFVAVNDQKVVGFAELLDGGEIDFFYCHHDYQRQGIGAALFDAVQAEAQKRRYPELTARVSTTAVQFFLRQGFTILEETNHLVCGAPAKQFLMAKSLDTGT